LDHVVGSHPVLVCPPQVVEIFGSIDTHGYANPVVPQEMNDLRG
jgi:hypothetical protein